LSGVGLRIQPAGNFNLTFVERMMSNDDTVAGTVIDLASARFVDTYGMVTICCAALSATARNEQLVFRRPAVQNTANYLARMNVGAFLSDECGLSNDLPDVRHHRVDPNTLCEVRRFAASDNLDELVDLLCARLEGLAPGDVVAELAASFWELSDNTRFHAQTDGGVLAAQVYEQGRPNQRVDLALGDVGIGIRRSLQNNEHESVDDADAIELALEEGVSGTGDPSRGYGLPSVVRRVRELGGQTTIRSGAGSRAIRPRSDATSRLGTSLRGTVVGVSIPCR
jgi:hypothetical protein